MTMFRRILLAAATSSLLVAALSGCASGSGGTVSSSGPELTLSPTALVFANQVLGTSSAPQTVTLTNSGSSPVAFTGVSASQSPFTPSGSSITYYYSYFNATSNCPATIAAGASCNVSVVFNPFNPVATPAGVAFSSPPVASGSSQYTSTITISDNAANGPQTFFATGEGVDPSLTLSANTLSFYSTTTPTANTLVGTQSAAQSVYFQNTGGSTMTITSITLGGANASNYTETNNCPATLPSLGACTVTATYTPTSTGTQTASIALVTNAANAGTVNAIALTGQGVTPNPTLSPTALTFPSTVVGSASVPQTITFTAANVVSTNGVNSGGAPIILTGSSPITLGGTNASSFSQTNNCAQTIAVATSCTISVTYTPKATGSATATLTITSNGASSPQTVTLTGTATAPTVGLSTSSLAFSTTQTEGIASAAQTVTLSNTGTGPLTLNGFTFTGTGATSYAQTNTCGATLANGSSCTISVTFDPAATGALPATLTIADNASNTPQTVALTGTGVTPGVLSLSSTSLTYNQSAGSTSATQVVLVTNNGPGLVNFSSIGLTGANASLFTETNSCGTTLIAEANCTITVSFSPTAAGSFTASVALADNSTPAPQSIALTGTSTTTAPVIGLSAPSLSFTQAAESMSTAQTVTLTNTGTAPLLISGIAVTGTNSWNFPSTNTCGTSVAVNGTCTISVQFNPSLAAAFSASVTISSNAPVAKSIALTGTGTGTLAINTSNASDWQITNGSLTIDWNSNTGAVFGVHLTGYTDNMVDTTTISSSGQPDGLYMDNTGQGTGTVTSGFSQIGNEYIDWWITTASNATNPFTYTQHFIITANDTGFHVYSTVGHSATDVAGSIGQWQYVFRINLNDFTTTYTNNEGLNNPGVQTVQQPPVSVSGNTDPGRVVSNAVEDLHGLSPIPASFLRQFYTKYDYANYNYLMAEDGVYGTNFGAWYITPPYGSESMVGGPTKQNLIFTNNLLIGEALSSHFASSLGYTPPQGVATNRFFGPFYYNFNAFTATNTTAAQLYAEAAQYEPVFNFLYDSDATMVGAGYVASTARGTVAPIVYNGGSATANTAWTVLSDPKTNFQLTNTGRQYWVNQNATGTAAITGVVPGTYRISSYVLGQWGEARQDNVVVTANQTTQPVLTFTPENFSNYTPIWTIGTPDRSGHEFLHGEDANGHDFRNYWGAYNYWSDFASTNGTQVYYATAEGSTPATNSPLAVNYTQWGTFDPGLFAGVYNSSDDTTDGYNYIVPSYVKTLTGESGTNGVTTPVPPLTIHFTTTAAQQAQGQYVVLSVGLACDENDVITQLNAPSATSTVNQLIWHAYATTQSDCMVRSGLSGYYQWVVFQWPTSILNAPGVDNVLTIGSNQQEGFTWDAVRMEITNTSSAPNITGWNDYEWVYGSQYVGANNAIPNP